MNGIICCYYLSRPNQKKIKKKIAISFLPFFKYFNIAVVALVYVTLHYTFCNKTLFFFSFFNNYNYLITLILWKDAHSAGSFLGGPFSHRIRQQRHYICMYVVMYVYMYSCILLYTSSSCCFFYYNSCFCCGYFMQRFHWFIILKQ